MSIIYIHTHSPFEFCISDQDSGIAGIFAVLSYWQPGEHFGVTILELIKEADVCVRVASFLQVLQVSPTWLGGIWIDDLVKSVSDICKGKATCHQRMTRLAQCSNRSRVLWCGIFSWWSSTFHPQVVFCVCVKESSGWVHSSLVFPWTMIWTEGWRLQAQYDITLSSSC